MELEEDSLDYFMKKDQLDVIYLMKGEIVQDFYLDCLEKILIMEIGTFKL